MIPILGLFRNTVPTAPLRGISCTALDLSKISSWQSATCRCYTSAISFACDHFRDATKMIGLV